MSKYQVADHLSKEDHKKLGADYTPEAIALQMASMFNLKETDREDWSDFKILDPTCGKGNLLRAMIETYPWLSNGNLWGVDIDSGAIEFCLKEFPGGHFQLGNILEDDITDDLFWDKDPLTKYEPKPTYFQTKSGFKFGK